MKRKYLIPIVVFIFVVFALIFVKGQSGTNRAQNPATAVVSESQTVLLQIDSGGEATKYEEMWKEGMTALNILESVAKENGVELDTTYYDEFDSTLVNGIGELVNTTELSWIYFVNGNAGDVGANQKVIAPGDLVEWKYIEPIY